MLGGEAPDAPGYDLLALAIGSEGMLMVVTEVTLKLLPKPQSARVVMASFDDVEKAGAAVADVIAAGIVPAGLEMMDRPATRAAEEFVGAGYDLDAAAILLCESDGMPEEVEDEIARVRAVLELAGIHDVLSKSLGSQNPINLVKATVAALQGLRSPDQVAELRGLTVREVLGLEEAQPAEEEVSA